MVDLGSYIKVMAFISLITGMQVYAISPAEELVEKMAISNKSLTYKGYFIYERDRRSNSFQIFHKVDDDVERQRLVFLDGDPYEVINDGHSLKCLHAGDINHQEIDEVPIDSGRLASSTSSGMIWANYSASIIGESRVANRIATKVQLSPKDQHRYPLVFFVDNETGIMLKMRVLNMQGQTLEQFHFSMIDFDNVAEEDLLPKIKDYKLVEHSAPENSSVSAMTDEWQINWLPSGFKKEKTGKRLSEAETKDPQVFMYSDGLSAFSVFIEPVMESVTNDTSSKTGSTSQTGSTSAISHYIQVHGNMFLVTVVGEIPIMTAKQIALSVEPTS